MSDPLIVMRFPLAPFAKRSVAATSAAGRAVDTPVSARWAAVATAAAGVGPAVDEVRAS